MSNFKEKAQDYFDRFPESTECHITSDGRVFHNAGQADSFASGLKNKIITAFKRSDVGAIEVKSAEVITMDTTNPDDMITAAEVAAKKAAEGTDASTEGADASIEASTEASTEGTDASTEASTEGTDASTEATGERNDLDAKLLAFDSTTATYPEVKALFAELKLEAKTKKQDDLVAAIVAAQETLKSKS